jgi:hypothetical protein
MEKVRVAARQNGKESSERGDPMQGQLARGTLDMCGFLDVLRAEVGVARENGEVGQVNR